MTTLPPPADGPLDRLWVDDKGRLYGGRETYQGNGPLTKDYAFDFTTMTWIDGAVWASEDVNLVGALSSPTEMTVWVQPPLTGSPAVESPLQKIVVPLP
jgi:hypothetical protein